jgi:hypothetical protein
MQRYTVTLINDTGGGRPSILVPFQPSSLVTAFKDEIVKRAMKHNLPVTAETDHLTLNKMQLALSKSHVESTTLRRIMLGGGARAEITVFGHDLLMNNYAYADGGSITNVVDESELLESFTSSLSFVGATNWQSTSQVNLLQLSIHV